MRSLVPAPIVDACERQLTWDIEYFMNHHK
jgi:hypothetical protein